MVHGVAERPKWRAGAAVGDNVLCAVLVRGLYTRGVAGTPRFPWGTGGLCEQGKDRLMHAREGRLS